MSFLFGSPKSPAPPPAPPTPADPDVQKRLEEAQRLQRMARGRASTIMTGSQGLLNEEKGASRVLIGN
jgi:hypothetical protein